MNIPFKKIYSGKIRDIYQIDNNKLLMVTSDRISAFDIILPDIIPSKGEILTTISNFWFDFLKDLIPNHLTLDNLFSFLPPATAQALSKRAVIVKKLIPIKCEAIVRGYVSGSAWIEYKKNHSINGIKINGNLQQSQKLLHPIFTPSTKAEIGSHDDHISFDTLIKLTGKDLAVKIKQIAIELYTKANSYANSKGIIIADTKFEFGIDNTGNLILMDEVLTPDSSRFWDKNEYKIGRNPLSYDKQFIRNYLEQINWNRQLPAPTLPKNIIYETVAKYNKVMRLITSC